MTLNIISGGCSLLLAALVLRFLLICRRNCTSKRLSERLLRRLASSKLNSSKLSSRRVCVGPKRGLKRYIKRISVFLRKNATDWCTYTSTDRGEASASFRCKQDHQIEVKTVIFTFYLSLLYLVERKMLLPDILCRLTLFCIKVATQPREQQDWRVRQASKIVKLNRDTHTDKKRSMIGRDRDSRDFLCNHSLPLKGPKEQERGAGSTTNSGCVWNNMFYFKNPYLVLQLPPPPPPPTHTHTQTNWFPTQLNLLPTGSPVLQTHFI